MSSRLILKGPTLLFEWTDKGMAQSKISLADQSSHGWVGWWHHRFGHRWQSNSRSLRLRVVRDHRRVVACKCNQRLKNASFFIIIQLGDKLLLGAANADKIPNANEIPKAHADEIPKLPPAALPRDWLATPLFPIIRVYPVSDFSNPIFSWMQFGQCILLMLLFGRR